MTVGKKDKTRKEKVISQSQTNQSSENLHRQVTHNALGILWISFNLSVSLDWESSQTWTLNENTKHTEICSFFADTAPLLNNHTWRVHLQKTHLFIFGNFHQWNCSWPFDLVKITHQHRGNLPNYTIIFLFKSVPFKVMSKVSISSKWNETVLKAAIKN